MRLLSTHTVVVALLLRIMHSKSLSSEITIVMGSAHCQLLHIHWYDICCSLLLLSAPLLIDVCQQHQNKADKSSACKSDGTTERWRKQMSDSKTRPLSKCNVFMTEGRNVSQTDWFPCSLGGTFWYQWCWDVILIMTADAPPYWDDVPGVAAADIWN